MAPESNQPSTGASASNATASLTASTSAPQKSISSTTPADGGKLLPHREKQPLRPAIAEEYAARDMLHWAAVVESKRAQEELYARKVAEVQDYKDIRTQYRKWFPPSRLYGEGYNGYGNGHTDMIQQQAPILYPAAKPRPGERKTPLLRVKRKDMKQQAEQVEELIPIRLEVEFDKIRLRDTFTWNLHDRVVPLKLFASQLVEDFSVPPALNDRVTEMVTHQMVEQMQDFCPQIYIDEDALDPELPYAAYKNDEMRILIKLNITIGAHTLVDQFEWDINNPLNSPEEFAASLSRELSLSGEFTTAIAHSIREQCELFTKSLYIVGHPFDGRPIEDADLIAAFLPSPLSSSFRPHQQAREYTPYLYELNEADLDKNELVLSREQRRQKRSVNRRGGPSLPDLKERQRTVRTLVVSSTLPGAAPTVEDSRLFKRAVGARGKRAAIGDGLSDSDSGDESVPESPAPSQMQGTARQRMVRGAATAAQQRMANLGREESEDPVIVHHHETRTSARRFGGRDDSPAPPSLVVKLKIRPEKLRQAMRNGISRGLHTRGQSSLGTPVRGSMGPPTTPGLQNNVLRGNTATPGNSSSSGQIGRVDAPPPPPPGQSLPPPPPPPTWLTSALSSLSPSYPADRFEGMMRYSAVDITTETPCQAPAPGENNPNVKWMWLPRIRCIDCPGKLYTPGGGDKNAPGGGDMSVVNFEVHLKNRIHREKVEARVRSEQQAGHGQNGSAQ